MAVSPHKSGRSIKENVSKTLLPNTFIFSFATKHFVRQRMQHSPPQGILILWRFTHSCSFQRLASDNDKTNCAEITRLSLLSRKVIGKKKQKQLCHRNRLAARFFGEEKRPPEISLCSQANLKTNSIQFPLSISTRCHQFYSWNVDSNFPCLVT